MTTIRSLIFVVWLYLSMVIFAVGLSPALLMPYRPAMWVIRSWSKFCLFGLRWIAGVMKRCSRRRTNRHTRLILNTQNSSAPSICGHRARSTASKSME